MDTAEEWVWFIQLFGDGHVQLIAPEECVDICLNLNISLKQGDSGKMQNLNIAMHIFVLFVFYFSVLIPQNIYYLQYMPSSNNLNVAIAVECHTH